MPNNYLLDIFFRIKLSLLLIELCRRIMLQTSWNILYQHYQHRPCPTVYVTNKVVSIKVLSSYRVFHAFWGILKRHISASSNLFKLLKKDLKRSWSAVFACKISCCWDDFWSHRMVLKSVCGFRVGQWQKRKGDAIFWSRIVQ